MPCTHSCRCSTSCGQGKPWSMALHPTGGAKLLPAAPVPLLACDSQSAGDWTRRRAGKTSGEHPALPELPAHARVCSKCCLTSALRAWSRVCSAIVRAGGGEVVALSAPADVLLVSAATAAGSTAAQRQVKAGGAVATAQFVVEWLAHPSASLDQHLLLRSRRSANLAAAEHARSHGGAASAGRPSESDERSLSM